MDEVAFDMALGLQCHAERSDRAYKPAAKHNILGNHAAL